MSIIMNIGAQAASVGLPVVVWTGIIASALTLFGTLGAVLITNRNNQKRLVQELQHDANQKEKDRLAALRKEVYLQAPKEMAKAMAYLGKLASRDLATIGDDEGISGYAAVAAQISVISDLPTVDAVSRLGNSLATELFYALRELQSVQDARVDIRIGTQRLEIVSAEIQRIQAEQQQMSELGVTDERRAGSLKYWLDARMEESAKLRDELDVLQKKQNRFLFEYHKGFFERLPLITKKSISVMRAVRCEIGLAHDLDEYEAQMINLSNELLNDALALMKKWS